MPATYVSYSPEQDQLHLVEVCLLRPRLEKIRSDVAIRSFGGKRKDSSSRSAKVTTE